MNHLPISYFKKKKKLILRFGLSILILFIFILGRKIPLPGASFSFPQASDKFFSGLLNFQSSQSSLFLFGLEPWIVVNILLSALTFSKNSRFHSLRQRSRDTIQYSLFLAFSSFQAFSFLQNIQKNGVKIDILLSITLFVTLVAGAFILFWLSSLNNQKGIGGFSYLILVGILTQFLYSLADFFLSYIRGNLSTFLFVCGILYLLLSIWLASVIEKTEYRLPLNRSSISSAQHQDAFFPIKFTPANSMPIMFASSFLRLAVTAGQFVISSLKLDSHFNAASILDTREIVGLSVYLLTIYALCLLLTPLSFDAKTIAKQMQRTGEYFDYVRPGKLTHSLLNRTLFIQAHIGAVYAVLFVGFPYFINLYYPLPHFFLRTPTFIIILVGMISTIIEQVSMLRIELLYKQK